MNAALNLLPNFANLRLTPHVLPALLQKLVCEFLKFSARKFSRKFGGNFTCFRTHKIKTKKKIGETFGEFFVKFIAKKHSLPKFALQTCLLNHVGAHMLPVPLSRLEYHWQQKHYQIN